MAVTLCLNSSERQVLEAFEAAVKRLSAEFQGRLAFNFSHEIDLTAHLLVWTRESPAVQEDVEGVPVSLARLEWPCIKGKSLDFILLRPGIGTQARSEWGTPKSRVAQGLPLLAAVQIKRGGGRVVSWALTRKDLESLEAVSRSQTLGDPLLYFIEWVDHGLRKPRKAQIVDTYREIKAELGKWCEHNPTMRRALVISRDNVGFAYPEGAWLVDPLPKGTIESV